MNWFKKIFVWINNMSILKRYKNTFGPLSREELYLRELECDGFPYNHYSKEYESSNLTLDEFDNMFLKQPTTLEELLNYIKPVKGVTQI